MIQKEDKKLRLKFVETLPVEKEAVRNHLRAGQCKGEEPTEAQIRMWIRLVKAELTRLRE